MKRGNVHECVKMTGTQDYIVGKCVFTVVRLAKSMMKKAQVLYLKVQYERICHL